MKRYLIFYIIFASIFLAHYFVSGHAVYGDGNDYWAWLHTWYFDGNIDQTNEFRHVFSPPNNNAPVEILSPTLIKTRTSPIGRTDNLHPPGTALFYLPFYFLADFIAVPKNGYSNAYQIFVGLGVVGYVTLSAFLTEKLLFHFTRNNNLSFITALAVFGATPLLYYGAYDLLNSHFASYLLSVCFWHVFFIADFSRPKPWVTAGLIISLAALVRLQDVLLFIPLLLKQPRKNLLIAGSVFFITFSPQLYNWLYLYGVPWPHTYINSLPNVYHSNFLGSLFHPITGLIRTPIIFIALLGMPLTPPLITPFLAFFIPTYTLLTYQSGWSAAARR